MTRDETKKILMILDASYPNFKTDDIVTQVDAWNLILGDFDYKDIEMAVKTYIVTSGSAFAPSVSEIIAMVRKPSELTQMDEVTAWRLVRKAIGRGIYYSREEYEKLPEEVQQAVGDPEQIRQWAMLESSEIDTVIQSNFKRRFETMQKRRLEIEAMPAEMQELIKQNTKTLEDYRDGAHRLPGAL